MAFAPAVGHTMKFYRNSATNATPTWVEIAQIGDLSIPDLSVGLAELKRRGNNFIKNLPTLVQSIAVEFRLLFGLDSTNYAILRAAFFARTVIQFAIANDAIASVGTEYLKLPAIIEQFPWDQAQEEVSGHDVRLATALMIEASAEVDPSWVVVSA